MMKAIRDRDSIPAFFKAVTKAGAKPKRVQRSLKCAVLSSKEVMATGNLRQASKTSENKHVNQLRNRSENSNNKTSQLAAFCKQIETQSSVLQNSHDLCQKCCTVFALIVQNALLLNQRAMQDSAFRHCMCKNWTFPECRK